ncbi:hypothetical protein K440DRAFT_612042 [Wilcoxina mikolae CBS 423.85]|nr:hypothetical protein K440DRAFT_612042 [Wilcoxina mikolae CBS 423.85]
MTGNTRIEFFNEFEDLLKSGDHSDLTITAGDTKFSVHKAILGLRTTFFNNATDPQKGFSEAQTNVVTVEEHSVHAVWRFLTYCYTGEYKDACNPTLGVEDDPPSAMHPRVHALADMLDVPKLKLLATKKLETQLKNWIVADFPTMVKEIYSSTTAQDGGIRDLLVATSKDHIEELVLREDFKAVMEEVGEFSAALVVAVSGRVSNNRCYNCDRIGQVTRRCGGCY